MGQIRNAECEKIERALRTLFPAAEEIDCREDTYTQDYIVWVTAGEEVRPIRITREEYQQDDWKANVQLVLSLTQTCD